MLEHTLDKLKKALCEGWRHFFDALLPDQRQMLVDLLREAYREEVQDALQFSQHAQRLPYPQFRERLLRIAEEERAHLEWLRDKLLALGAEVPDVTVTPKGAKSTWEALLMDLEEEKRSYVDLLEAMHLAEQVDLEIAEGLRRIREEERQHREEILEMLVKIDPYTLPQAPREESLPEGLVQGKNQQV
jgi:rubrerythrin